MTSSVTPVILWPMITNVSPLDLLAAAAAIYAFLRLTKSRETPPGPPSVPILGNIWRLNPKAAWHDLTALTAKYGEILSKL
jgi:hypothetical protein